MCGFSLERMQLQFLILLERFFGANLEDHWSRSIPTRPDQGKQTAQRLDRY